MKKFKLINLICIILSLIILNGCGDQQNAIGTKNNISSTSTKKVAILKLGSHVLIDEVEAEIFKGLKSHYGDSVKISVFNANFEDDLLKQSVDQIKSTSFDVAVPITTPASIALINGVSKKQKIVFSFVSSPESLWGETGERPENVTGASDQIDYDKNLKLIATVFPKATKIGYIVNEAEANAKIGFEEVKTIAPKLGFSIIAGSVGQPSDVSMAAKSIVDQVDVFLVGGDNTVVSGIGGLLSTADKNNKPVFAVERTSVEKGCIAAYGVDYSELGKQTSELVINVLEGHPVKSLPIVYFKETKLYVNRAAFSKANAVIPNDVFQIY